MEVDDIMSLFIMNIVDVLYGQLCLQSHIII